MAQDTSTDQPGRCHILRLANETLDQICQELSDDRSALASLRLSCRSFSVLPEKTLFTTIYLDRRSSSLDNLRAMSKHDRLRHHITDIRLELEFTLPGLSRLEWEQLLYTYPNFDWDSYIIESQHCVFRRRLRLVKEISAMKEEDKERAWCSYLAIRAEEKDLEGSYSAAMLAEIFAISFRRLPNLHRLNHGVYDPSGPFKWYNDTLKRSDRESLVLATSAEDWTSADRNFITTYATAFISCLFYSGAPMQYVNLGLIHWDVLEKLGEMWQSYKALPSLPKLTALVLSPYYPGDKWPSRVVKHRGLSTMSMLATAAPNMRELKWASGPAVFGSEDFDCSELGVPSLPKGRSYWSSVAGVSEIQVPWHPQNLVLAGIYTTQDELLHLFQGLCISIKRIELYDVAIEHQEDWVSVFADMHNTLSLDEFEISGRLEERDAEFAVTWFELGEVDIVGGYKSRLQQYVTRASNAAPWRTRAEGGGPHE